MRDLVPTPTASLVLAIATASLAGAPLLPIGLMPTGGASVGGELASAWKGDEILDRAHAGDAEAMYLVGVMHADGRGVEEDDAAAVSWFRRA